MNVSSMSVRSVSIAAAAAVAAAAVIGVLGAGFFRSTPAQAEGPTLGITPVEAALGVKSKPVTLAMVASTSAGTLTEAVDTDNGSLSKVGGPVGTVKLKATPRAKPKPVYRSPAGHGASPASHPGAGARPRVVASGGGGVPQSTSGASGSWRVAKCSTFGIGDGLVGSGLAGGGTLHEDSMIVAHKKLPFGTRIQFSYNGKSCVAIVKDRGPYVTGREFDLGPGVANALGFDGVDYLRYRIMR